jgi:hypothetical protein
VEEGEGRLSAQVSLQPGNATLNYSHTEKRPEQMPGVLSWERIWGPTPTFFPLVASATLDPISLFGSLFGRDTGWVDPQVLGGGIANSWYYKQ